MQDLEKTIRILQKRLSRSDQRRSELEHLKDVSHALQRRLIQDVEQSKIEIEEKSRELERLNLSLEAEKRRTDQLLHSIMPEKVAAELKANGRVKPIRIECATVMFTDFVDFTRTTEHLDPVELVATLDFYTSEFDRIVESIGVEKLKVIGDAYMCVSGATRQRLDHAERMVLAAQEILAFVKRIRAQPDTVSGIAWDIRIGINSGPVSAGVIGQQRFSYDIWGDTVNTAARVLAACEVNDILIAESTKALVRGRFSMSEQETIEAKGKGKIAVYRVAT